MEPNPKGVMEANNKLALEMDKKRRESSGYKAQLKAARSKALEKKKVRNNATGRDITLTRHGNTPGGTEQYKDRKGNLYGHHEL